MRAPTAKGPPPRTVTAQDSGRLLAEIESEHAALKDEAASLTQVADAILEQVMMESRAERLRIQREADSSRAAASPSASVT